MEVNMLAMIFLHVVNMATSEPLHAVEIALCVLVSAALYLHALTPLHIPMHLTPPCCHLHCH
eukprot:6447138-Prorocentrum_lima.AAC.1